MTDQYRLPSLVRVRIVPPPGTTSSALERVSWLGPYEAETIGEDARRAGPGTQVIVTVPSPTSTARLDAVRALFAWLTEKGIEVRVGTADEP